MSDNKRASVIGIDFGTTNTAVYEITESNGALKERIFSEGGDFSIPSVLSFSSDNRISFGSSVRKSLEDEDYLRTHAIVSSFKSFLGTDKRTPVFEKEYSPVDLTAYYLSSIVEYVQGKYNVEIKEAVFSYPVDFSPQARKDLCEAAQKAGISVLSMITESTGAFLAVQKELSGFSNIMVIDWGGGTFDISILSVKDKKLMEKSVYGVKVGGDDIDLELAKYVHSKIISSAGAEKRIPFDEMPSNHKQKLISMCERAKIQISETEEDFSFTLLKYGIYGTKTIEITMHELSEIVKPIISSKILPAINTALVQAQMSAISIDRVIIAGGSSNLTPYANAIMRIFGAEKVLIPEKTVFISAKGAAMLPLVGNGVKLADDVGILLSDNTIFPILKKNGNIKNSHKSTVTFSLVEDSSDAHFIITNSDGTMIYDKISIPTKGFLRENIEVTACLTSYQTAEFNFHNDTMADAIKDTNVQICKLTFFYDLSEIQEGDF